MNVLIACEESQRVCKAFRDKGHNAFSCDIVPPSGNHPEWHILGDALKIIKGGTVITMDGKEHIIGKWDLMIAHPPCTYLSNASTSSFSLKVNTPEYVVNKWKNRAEAVAFFMFFYLAPIERVAVENPVGFINHIIKPSQIIEPYQFAKSKDDPEYQTKRTCLWIRGLPNLKTNDLPRPDNAALYGRYKNGKPRNWTESSTKDPKARSKTFYGIANAMANQWG